MRICSLIRCDFSMGTFLQIDERADGQHDNNSPSAARVPTDAQEIKNRQTFLTLRIYVEPGFRQLETQFATVKSPNH